MSNKKVDVVVVVMVVGGEDNKHKVPLKNKPKAINELYCYISDPSV